MDDLVVVDEEKTLTHLLHHLFYLPQAELHVDVAEQASQVMLTEFKHQVGLSYAWCTACRSRSD